MNNIKLKIHQESEEHLESYYFSYLDDNKDKNFNETNNKFVTNLNERQKL